MAPLNKGVRVEGLVVDVILVDKKVVRCLGIRHNEALETTQIAYAHIPADFNAARDQLDLQVYGLVRAGETTVAVEVK